MANKRRKGEAESSRVNDDPQSDSDGSGNEEEIDPMMGVDGEFMGLNGLNATQQGKWGVLKKRKISITMFCDWSLVERFGLAEYFNYIIPRGNLGTFLSKSAETYRRYTLEFLSTLEVTRPKRGEAFIMVNINDVRRKITYPELREIFGFPPPRTDKDRRRNKKPDSYFWSMCSHADALSDNYRTYNIDHPVFALLYRYLSMTVYGSGEPGKFNMEIIGHLYSFLEEGPFPPDWVDVFVRNCEKCALKSGGKIAMGGMITLIVESFMPHPIEHPFQARLKTIQGGRDPHMCSFWNLVLKENFRVKDTYSTRVLVVLWARGQA